MEAGELRSRDGQAKFPGSFEHDVYRVHLYNGPHQPAAILENEEKAFLMGFSLCPERKDATGGNEHDVPKVVGRPHGRRQRVVQQMSTKLGRQSQ